MSNLKRVLFSESDYAAVAVHFKDAFPLGGNIQKELRTVLCDSLNHPGSLIRGQLAFKLLTVHDLKEEISKDIAIALEYFHLSSLIFDDLSCMDNATYRRGQLCVHKKHGEAAAILGALAFINRAYSLIWKHTSHMNAETKAQIVDLLDTCLGPSGILNGQARDLYFSNERPGRDAVTAIAKGKTVNLIRLSLLLPAILAGADAGEIIHLDRISNFIGLSYQILDDFKDVLSSAEQTGKSTNQDGHLERPNYVLAEGIEDSYTRLQRLQVLTTRSIDRLSQKSPRWNFLKHLQSFLIGEIEKIESVLPVERKAAANE